MKHIPVYFPMTHLPADSLNRLAGCLGKILVYRPADSSLPEAMQAAAQQGWLQIETPALTEPDELAAQLEAYYAWAAENKGVDLAAIKGRDAGIPFFGDSTVSGIRQNIRAKGDQGGPADTPDPLLAARLFLSMAQELDQQDNELEKSLDEVRVREDNMLLELMGDADHHPEVAAALHGIDAADPGAYMTGSRIKAWRQLARAGNGPGNLLVTDSRAVCDYLIERSPGLQKTGPELVLPLPPPGESMPATWQPRLMEYLAALISSPAEVTRPLDLSDVEPEAAVVHFSIYRQAGIDADTFFSGLDASGSRDNPSADKDNLVICLIVMAGNGD